jgi:hypothetical protein
VKFLELSQKEAEMVHGKVESEILHETVISQGIPKSGELHGSLVIIQLSISSQSGSSTHITSMMQRGLGAGHRGFRE